MLRDYQQRAIDDLYQWFRDGGQGNPVMVLPTGSGKSHIVAELCRDALNAWPDIRILMLTHQRELIAQNAAKLRAHWPNAPMGIYSAGMNRRELGEPVTFAGIQSVRDKALQIGRVDLVLVDECHLINHKEEGGYRQLIGEMKAINPHLRVVGLTATPYRLGHGLITEGDALFDALLEPVSIEELVYRGFLAPLRSKPTEERLTTDGVKKRGGEYVEKDLQRAVDTDDHNQAVVDEVISLAGDRRSWLFFCTGVEHAEHVAAILNERGIIAACVTGKTQKGGRDKILEAYKSGEIQALTNANVLTTGFDAPNTDLIAMLRPTMSPVLYVQMAGRGMRLKDHTDHCLVLDFAGVVEQHGPITAVQPPNKSGNGEAPIKVCESCSELVALSAPTCPACGYEFEPPEPKEKGLELRHDDIMGLEGIEMAVSSWSWRKHVSKSSGKEMIKATYYGACLSDKPITEYFPIMHGGFAGQKAIRAVADIANEAGCSDAMQAETLEGVAECMDAGTPPAMIEYKRDGKFFRVIRRQWEEEPANV